MKTYSIKSGEITRKWHLIDAKTGRLGRLATQIAIFLMGKHKPEFTAHLDMGDHVVVINAADVEVTGRKELQKVYHRHSGFPGGKRETPLFRMRATFPERIILKAVSGMLPDNKLKAKRLLHLHIFKDSNHPYTKNFKKITSELTNSQITN